MPQKDFAQIAFSIVQKATGDAPKPGKRRRGGVKGGPARAKALSAKRRSEIARLAAAARWKKSD